MDTEEIDDLFRAGLDGHASPPGGDLWARLQAKTAADDAATSLSAAGGPDGSALPSAADDIFRRQLTGHVTPPRRELWERLEDEHLRPRKRREPVAAWWPMAIAAAVALLLVAGGAEWWRTSRLGSPSAGVATVRKPATQPGTMSSSRRNTNVSGASVANMMARANDAAEVAVVTSRPAKAAGTPVATALFSTASGASQARSFSFTTQATWPRRAASAQISAPAGAGPGAGRPAPTPLPVAVNTTPPTADPLREQPQTAPATTPTPALALAESDANIEVEVKPGGHPGQLAASPAVAAVERAYADEPRGRRLLGGLLRQADHLVRGERLSLAEATGLPQNVTLKAHLAGRTLTKTIRL